MDGVRGQIGDAWRSHATVTMGGGAAPSLVLDGCYHCDSRGHQSECHQPDDTAHVSPYVREGLVSGHNLKNSDSGAGQEAARSQGGRDRHLSAIHSSASPKGAGRPCPCRASLLDLPRSGRHYTDGALNRKAQLGRGFAGFSASPSRQNGQGLGSLIVRRRQIVIFPKN